MPDEITPAEPFSAMQQQIVRSLFAQIVSATNPGVKDALGLLEQVAANVLANSGEETEDEARLAAFTDAVRQRLHSLRHPS